MSARIPLVLTVIGADRAGIVADLARIAGDCGAGWQQSRMARLAGQFAGIARLDVPEAQYETLERSLRELESEGLEVTIARDSSVAGPAEAQRSALELVGHDRDGIVRDVSAVLARHGVSIEELDTGVEDASMSGERLFRARADLALPGDVSLEALRADLEKIADELMVDLSLDDVHAESR